MRCVKLPVTRILVDLLQNELQYASRDGEQFFDATQNARLVANAERYYRVMYYGSHESWNLRDRHMFDTLQRVLAWAGPDTKAVVWAHNSHIGDARFTDMGTERGEVNIGQLCRQAYGSEVALIGFGTHSGTVAAASEWDAPMEIKTVRPSRPDSYEGLCHQLGHERFLLDLRRGLDSNLRGALAQPRLERYIGVIYRPETERWSHYSSASLADQYDAFVWFDQTHAVDTVADPSHGRRGRNISIRALNRRHLASFEGTTHDVTYRRREVLMLKVEIDGIGLGRPDRRGRPCLRVKTPMSWLPSKGRDRWECRHSSRRWERASSATSGTSRRRQKGPV